MKKTALIVLALILGALLLLSTACSKPENGKVNETTLAPDTQAAPDSGTEKEEETALPDETSGEDTDAEATPEPDDTQKEEPPAEEPEDTGLPEPWVFDKLLWKYYNYCATYNGFESHTDESYMYITHYYGTFNNAVAVCIDSPQFTHDDAIYEEEIAGITFCHPGNLDIMLWLGDNISFFSLSEAYDEGIISEEDLLAISEADPWEFEENEFVFPPVRNYPEEAAEGVLDQVAEDYYYYSLEDYRGSLNHVGEYYVNGYYGTYDGAVAVNMLGTRISYIDDCYIDEIIAGYLFSFTGDNTIIVWKDGEFYDLSEAYDQGILTKEHIGQIDKTKPIEYDDAEHCFPNADNPVDETYAGALIGVCVLDEALRNEISESIGEDLTWLDHDKLVKGEFYDICCYGRFGHYGLIDNCTVLFTWGVADEEVTVKIADSEFYYPSSMNLYGYYDGVLYSLEEAYEKGFINEEEIEKAAENHRAVQEYLNNN